MASVAVNQNPAQYVVTDATTPLLGSSSHEHSHSGSSSAASSETERLQDEAPLTLIRSLLCSVALGILLLLQAMNISMLTTTQSRIADELDSFETATWFTSAYLIAMSATSPLYGKLSTILGPRSCIFVSSVILAGGSLISGLSTRHETFIAGRAVTGAGAGGILTLSTIVVLELSGPKRRGLAMGLLNSGVTFGVAAGAAVAGALLPQTGWRPLFYAQSLPILVCGIVLFLAIPHNFASQNNRADGRASKAGMIHHLARLDYFGAVSLTITIVLVLYSLSAPRKIPLLPLFAAPVSLATFVLNELYLAADPIIPLALLRSRGLLMTCLSTGGYMMARWSVLFYTPTYALAVRGWSPASAGSILIPTNGGFAVGGLLVGWLHIRRQGTFYGPSVVALILGPCTIIALALLSTASSSVPVFVLVVFLNGAVTGATLNYTLAHLLHLTPKSSHYVAMSLLTTFRGVAGSFGSAIGGGLFMRRLRESLEARFASEGIRHPEELIRRLLGSPALVQELAGKQRVIAVEGYQDALRLLWFAAAGLAILMVFVQAAAGRKGAETDSPSVPEESIPDMGT